MQTVVVPLTDPWQDPDRVAECALPFARELAARGHARVVLVNVIEVPAELGPLSGALGVVFSKGLEKWASDCREYLEAVARTFEGGDVRTVVLHGEVGSQLLMLLDEVPDPVVVMASHCRRGPRRLLFGSVAFQLVHAARCPVMVVPPEFRRLHDPAPIGLHRVLVPLDGTVSGDETLRVLGDVLGDGLRIQLLRVLESSDAAWYYTEVERAASWPRCSPPAARRGRRSGGAPRTRWPRPRNACVMPVTTLARPSSRARRTRRLSVSPTTLAPSCWRCQPTGVPA